MSQNLARASQKKKTTERSVCLYVQDGISVQRELDIGGRKEEGSDEGISIEIKYCLLLSKHF